MMDWYYSCLHHPGAARMSLTINDFFHWYGIPNDIIKFVSKCDTYQLKKITGVKHYSKLPLSTLLYMDPWEIVQVDMIGPWTVKFKLTKQGKTVQKDINGLIMLDCVSIVHAIFDKEWLCRYHRPTTIIHDTGNEFNALEFQELLQSYGIFAKSTTVKNHQANLIIKNNTPHNGRHATYYSFHTRELV